MNRSFVHAIEHPLDGDVVEIKEACEVDCICEIMLRVIAVREDHVWFKEYGMGRKSISLKSWTQRLNNAKSGVLVRNGEGGLPY